MSATLTHNLGDVSAELQKTLEKIGTVLTRLARIADTRVAARAIGDYMRDAGFDSGERSKGDYGPLRISKGRLARAVKGSKESRVSFILQGAKLFYKKLIEVPYAAIHEYGGTITLQITTSMRRFFWAMYFDTGKEKWKFMALSPKKTFVIRIHPRPYLAPALDDEEPFIIDLALKMFEAAIQPRPNA